MAMAPAPPARPARPRRQARRERLRPPRLGARLRRRPDGGRASEASSLAGHQELGNLTVVYDANQISIEDDTDISFSEDVAKRYEAYGWDVVDIDWRRSNPRHRRLHRGRRHPARARSRRAATRGQAHPRAPAHRHRLAGPHARGHRQVARLRARRRRGRRHQGAARLRPGEDLRGRPRGDRPHPGGRRSAARPPTRRGTSGTPRGARPNPERAALLDRLVDGAAARRLREGAARVPGRRQGRRDPRGIRQGARSARRRCCPSCGAARPTSPSPTTPRWPASRRSSPKGKQTHEWKGGPYGRTLHFGIRENAMGMILNGIALEG